MTASGPPLQSQYWRDRLAGEVSLRTVGWTRLGVPFNRALYRQRRRVLRRLVHQAGVRIDGARMLEVAPGSGFYLEEWIERGAREIVAVDVSPEACAMLQRRFPSVDVACADWTQTDPRQWGQFDIVTAFDVLFHFLEPEAHRTAVRNLARACAPGGWVLFSDTMPRRAPTLRGATRLYAEEHYREILGAAGLRIEVSLPVFVLMHPWFDTRVPALGRAFNVGWYALENTLYRLPVLGHPAGWILEAADAALTRAVRRGPTQKLFACRRVTAE